MTTEENLQPRDTWNGSEEPPLSTTTNTDSPTPTTLPPANTENQEYVNNGASVDGDSGEKPFRGEKQIKPNKVYIGGLPEHTREEDLQSCFGKIGTIVNIELKVGYGFVEFESRVAAEESVAKYHEGYFMGNKIRVELSHGGGRTAKFAGDPGACFRCGQMGHWARECPNGYSKPLSTSAGTDLETPSGGPRRHEPIADRMQTREYLPPRDYALKDDYARLPPPRDRSGYDYPPPPREYGRRPPSPGRDYPPPPPPRGSRDYDDYRRFPLPPSARYDSRPYGPDDGPGYPPRYGGPPPPPPRGYGAPIPPPARDPYDRYDRRPPPPADRYAPYPPPNVRPRTPPGMLASRPMRDDYSARDYHPPPDYRGRPMSPPSRYHAEYAPRPGSPPDARYRRRSASPQRGSLPPPYDPGYGNGYAGGGSSGPPSLSGGPMRGGGSRDYVPRNRDPGDPGYRRP